MIQKILLLVVLTVSTLNSGSLLNDTFQETKPLKYEVIPTSSEDLLNLTKSTLGYFKNPQLKKDQNINSKLFKNKNSYLKNTHKSLRALESTLKKSSSQSVNLEELNKHFRYIKWNGDVKTAAKNKVSVPNGNIRLTKYLVFKMKGSKRKTLKYRHALYSLPRDEVGLSNAQIEKRKSLLTRFKYTKQNIVAGALERGYNPKLVKPLVWVTREGLEEALMQGTIVLEIPGNGKRIFNVHKNNEIPYNKSLKNKKLQKRYWYFKEPKGFNGYGWDFSSRVTIFPEVTFAGDVKNIGFGTIIAIRYTNPITHKIEVRIGIIADTGAAFADNLYQLDYFTGAFKSHAEFKHKTKNIPDHVEAFILVKK